MTATLRPLDPPHKGLRNALSILSLRIGVTDFRDADSVSSLQRLADEVFLLLEDHALMEDTHVLAPLEQRVPGSSRGDLADHEALEVRVADLRRRLHEFDGSQDDEAGQGFLLEFSDFHADYLKHMLEEERITEPLVRHNFSDEELLADQVAISQEMPFEVLLLWFKYIVPARRVAENAQVLQGFKAAAPPEVYQQVTDLLRDTLPTASYDALMARVESG